MDVVDCGLSTVDLDIGLLNKVKSSGW